MQRSNQTPTSGSHDLFPLRIPTAHTYVGNLLPTSKCILGSTPIPDPAPLAFHLPNPHLAASVPPPNPNATPRCYHPTQHSPRLHRTLPPPHPASTLPQSHTAITLFAFTPPSPHRHTHTPCLHPPILPAACTLSLPRLHRTQPGLHFPPPPSIRPAPTLPLC